MKASESSDRYIGKVRECCNYAVRSAKSFADSSNNEHRQTGGDGEAELRSSLQADLTSFCDEVDENPFGANQKAYVVSNTLTFVFMLLSIALAIVIPILSLNSMIFIVCVALSLLALLAFFGAFNKTSKAVDDMNLFAKRKPTGERTQRVILAANIDAPYKRNVTRKKEVGLKFLCFFGLLLYLAFDVVTLLLDHDVFSMGAFDSYFSYLAYPLILFLIIPIVLARSVKTGSSFPGVTGNLIGAYTAAGVMRYMSEMNLRLEHTELCVLITSAWSTGSEGAHAFVKDYAQTLKEVDTTILVLDSLYDPESLNVTAKGRKLNKLIAQAAENGEILLTDHTPKYHKGDAKVFQKAGIPTALISTLPDEVPEFYRGEDDNTDLLNVRAVEGAIQLALETAYLKDAPKD